MFLHLSVCPQAGVSASVHSGDTNPPRSRHPNPPEQTPPWCSHPPGADTPRSRLPQEQTPPQEQTLSSPLVADGYCCRQYESYWNAFLLHLSVILFTGGVVSQHALQVVSQHALQVSRPTPRGGKLRGIWPGGLQAHTQWGKLGGIWPGGGVSRFGRYASYWNAFLLS